MCPSVLLILPAAPSSKPCSYDSVEQSFCNAAFHQVSFLRYSYQYCICPLHQYFSFSPGLPAQFVYLLRHPFSPCLNHFTCYPICLGFCFSLLDLLLFPLPHIGYRLLPMFLLRSVLMQSSPVHPPTLCCFRCCCIIR